MAYQLINGAVINGSGSPPPTSSLRPVRFGTPSLAILPTSMRPVTFGVHQAKYGTDIAAAPVSIHSVRFGAHSIIGGMPPNAAAKPASSLRPLRFGAPSVTAVFNAGPVSALQPARFGTPKAVTALPASSLRPTTFGTPLLFGYLPGTSLRPVRFGVARAAHHLTATPWRRVRFGPISPAPATVDLAANPLRSVQFGKPLLGGVALRTRAMHPTRFGRPTLDRGPAC